MKIDVTNSIEYELRQAGRFPPHGCGKGRDECREAKEKNPTPCGCTMKGKAFPDFVGNTHSCESIGAKRVKSLPRR
jgi:hypothetical protein